MAQGRDYTRRLLDDRISSLFTELPALLLTGPRATGKTTTARRHVQTVLRLDRPGEAAAFRADPDAALAVQREPMLLDEWQAVPEVLGAVKRAVDDDPRPGRFLLTGSAVADLRAQTWPGTGRVVRLAMYGMTVRELAGKSRGPTFLDRLVSDDPAALPPPADVPDLPGYIALALAGGYPEPVLRLSPDARSAWIDSYLDQLVTRDAELLAGPRDPARLRRYLRAIALNTAGVPEHKTLYDAAAINRRTAVAYDQLLTNLFVLDHAPAWVSNRLTRMTRSAKRYLVDSSLAGGALGLDVAAVMRDGNMLGRLLDTFVAAQLRPELEVTAHRPALHHLREKDGRREIDIVIEMAGGGIVALEVKASAAATASDARHLAWLRDRLGDRFLAGAVLHTGPAAFRFSDRLLALPICTLWGGPEGGPPDIPARTA